MKKLIFIVMVATVALLLMGGWAQVYADDVVASDEMAAASDSSFLQTALDYLKENGSAEAAGYLIFGGGTPKAAAGSAVYIYEAFDGKLRAGLAYTRVMGADPINLAGPAVGTRLLRLLPGDVDPLFGIVDPTLTATAMTDINMPFKRIRFGAGLSVLNWEW